MIPETLQWKTTAIVLRGIFVAAGAATLQEFHQVLLLFSAILAYSSFKVLFAGDDDEEEVWINS